MRAVLLVLAEPALLLLLVWGMLGLDRMLPRIIAPRPVLGWLLVVPGVLLAVWCVGLLAWFGRGTPHPFAAKTKQLVVSGPYRTVRNPMLCGVGMVLLGSMIALGSTGLLLLWPIFLSWCHLFVTRYEEKDLERRFGEQYRDYCRRTPRWWPRFPS